MDVYVCDVNFQADILRKIIFSKDRRFCYRYLLPHNPVCSRCCLKIHIFPYRMGTRWGGHRHRKYTHNSSISSWALSYLLANLRDPNPALSRLSYSDSSEPPDGLRLASSRSIIKRPPLASPISLSCSKTPPTLSSSSTCSETNHCRKIWEA